MFVNVPAAPVPSLLRNFSAPVNVKYDYSEADLTHLMAHDANAFNRWEAGQRLALALILKESRRIAREARARAPPWQRRRPSSRPLRAYSPTRRATPAFAAEALALPSEVYIAEQLAEVDPDAIHAVRNALRRDLAQACAPNCSPPTMHRPCPARTARTRRRRASARCAIYASAT